MGLHPWQLNTALTTILFISTSLALVEERCDKDRFCNQYYDGSFPIEKENRIDREQRRTNLDDLRRNTWRRTGREDLTRDRLLRAEWFSEPSSAVELRDHVDGAGMEQLTNPRIENGGRDNPVDFSNDERLLIGNERERIQNPEREPELDLERREVQRTQETKLLSERCEEIIREKPFQRRDHLQEKGEIQSRNRFDRGERMLKRNSEDLLERIDRKETIPERFDENHVQQHEKQDQREGLRQRADQIEARSRISVSLPVYRNLEEGSDRKDYEPERREDENRDTVRTDRRDLALDRIQDERREQNRRLDSRENSVRLITRKTLRSDQRENSRQRQIRLAEEYCNRIQREDSIQSIPREESLGHALQIHRRSSRNRVDLSRSEGRREENSRERLGRSNSRQLITREETVRSDRLEDSRGCQTDQLKVHNDRNREEYRREDSQKRVDREASSRREEASQSDQREDLRDRADQEDSRRHLLHETREQFGESTERREERSRKSIPENQFKRPLDRLSNLHERLPRSMDRQEDSQGRVDIEDVRRIRKETIRSDQREHLQDSANIEDSRRKLLHQRQESLSGPTERHEERRRGVVLTEKRVRYEDKEDLQADRRGLALDRLSNHQRKELSRSEDQREDLRERVDREGARTLRIREEAFRSNRREDSYDRAGREDSRRKLLLDEREGFGNPSQRTESTMKDVAIDRRRENFSRNTESIQTDRRALDHLSSQQREELARSKDRYKRLQERIYQEDANRFSSRDETIRSNRLEDSRDRGLREDSRRHILREQQDLPRESSERHEDWGMENGARSKVQREELQERVDRADARRLSRQEEAIRSNQLEDLQDRANREDSRRHLLLEEQEQSRQFPEQRCEKLSQSEDQRTNQKREDREDVKQLSRPEDAGRSNRREDSRDPAARENSKRNLLRKRRERLKESFERRKRMNMEDINRYHENLYRSEDQRENKEREYREIARRREVDRRQISGDRQIRHLEARAERADQENSNLSPESRERLEERSSEAVQADSRGHAFDRHSNQEREELFRSEDNREDLRRIDRENDRRLNREENSVEHNVDRFDGLTKRADREISRSRLLRERRERTEGDRLEDSRRRVERVDARRENTARSNRQENLRECQIDRLEDRAEGADINELRRHISHERRERLSDSTERCEETSWENDSSDRLNRLSNQHDKDISRSEDRWEDRVDRENVRRLSTQGGGISVDQHEYSRMRQIDQLKELTESAEQDNLKRHMSRESRREEGGREDSRERVDRKDPRRLITREEATRTDQRNDYHERVDSETDREVREKKVSTFYQGSERLKNSIQNTERAEREEPHEGDDFMNYSGRIIKYSTPSLLTMIQGALLATVIMKSLSFENIKLGNGIFFKALEQTGATES